MADASLLTTTQPHLIPGYAGYCPQYRFRCGETYGSLTHKLLLDPTINHAETLVLSNRLTDDYEVQRPAKNDIDIVNSRFKRLDPIYAHPMVPGYQGLIPNFNSTIGQRYSVRATEALGEFERQQIRNEESSNRLKKVIGLQNGRGDAHNNEERLLLKSEFKLPLIAVRPDCVRVMRNLPVDEQCEKPRDHSVSPFFMENTNPDKYLVSGYAGHIPYGYAHFGASNAPLTNSSLCEFTTNYRTRQSTEWAPASIARPDPPLEIQPSEIYHKHVGLIPNYFGHVPGANFRFGKTFGADTKDAKRWLRGDFSI